MAISMREALQAFLKKSQKIEKAVHAIEIKDKWEAIVGKAIAKYTENIQLVNETLFIKTQEPALRTELNYQKEKLIEKIKEHLPEIKIKEIKIE